MFDIFTGVILLYVFVAIGYVWRKYHAPNFVEKEFTKLNVYFMQPLLVFWGFSKYDVTQDVLWAALAHFALSVVLILIFQQIAKLIFHDPKNRAIYVMSAVLGNTGNLGIPMGLIIFGPESLPYTTALNLACVINNATFGVYGYSRGSFSVRESLINVLKFPLLWANFFAIGLNLLGVRYNDTFQNFLEIGGHSSLALQLMLLGVFLARGIGEHVEPKLWIHCFLFKFVFITIAGVMLVQWLGWNWFLGGLLLMELIVPPAVNNINLASLYDCYPFKVAKIVFVFTMIAAVLVPGILLAVKPFL